MRFTKSQRSSLYAAIVALVVCVACLQIFIDPLRRQKAIEPQQAGMKKVAIMLPFQYTLGAVSGFRQVIAGMLWVRSDAFFHEGNYDAILPLIRLITWLDPNWLDPYSTGAWHLMYNFTDTDQRSDRRYIPAGMALLREGVDNNPQIYDMYKELGWNNFDKVKDFAEAAKWYELAEKNDPQYDITTVGHQLAHCYERTGEIDKAIAEWQKCVDGHKKLLDDPKSTLDIKSRNKQGYENSLKNLTLLKERQAVRPHDTKPPVESDLHLKVERIDSKILQVSGTMNLVGAKNWQVGKGILQEGPVSGDRIEVRLQDAGYVVPTEQEFSFEVDKSLTIMQDSISIRGGRDVKAGGLYMLQKTENPTDTAPAAQMVNIFGFGPIASKGLGVPLQTAITTGSPALSPLGQLQAVSVAYPIRIDPNNPNAEKQYSPAEVTTLMAKLKGDTNMLVGLTKVGYCVASHDASNPATFSRKFDMSKDPGMYSFTKGDYDVIMKINPQSSPDFVKDRTGWVGEGWTDKRYLDDKTLPGVRLLRKQIEIKKDDIIGKGPKVLFTD